MSSRNVAEPDQMQVSPFKPVLPLHARACHLDSLCQTPILFASWDQLPGQKSHLTAGLPDQHMHCYPL